MVSSVGVAGLRSHFLTDNSTDNSSKENGSGDGGEIEILSPFFLWVVLLEESAQPHIQIVFI
uniref:Uncharacterized protein n=1 Tax=Nelumbo nucifera TaxID=4432 RepID=A0A822XXE8_NELNU|nr:TPA_asm: hypothetical protein HUJ06_026461 [Nelumbo nucifera]